MGIFMNTRHSGSESGHVTAELEALINEATFGAGNYVFEAGNKFSITVTPVTGNVNISNGVFSWCGRLGGVDEFETVQYTPPGSETLYKKIIIGAKYTKTPATLVENISLTAIESEVQSSESAAAGVTLTLDSDEIKPDTTNAFLPLWEFTANSKTHSTPVKKFNTVNNLSYLLDRIEAEATARASADNNLQKSINSETAARSSADNNLQKNINTEATARASADTGLDNRLKEIEKRYELITDDVNNNGNYDADINKYTMFCLMVGIEENESPVPVTFPAIEGSFRIPMHFPEKATLGYNVDTIYVCPVIHGDYIHFNFTGNSDRYFSPKELYGIK